MISVVSLIPVSGIVTVVERDPGLGLRRENGRD